MNNKKDSSFIITFIQNKRTFNTKKERNKHKLKFKNRKEIDKYHKRIQKSKYIITIKSLRKCSFLYIQVIISLY